jgi:endothelin-converting enzyme
LLTTSKSADEENFDKMKSAYDACLDVDAIAKLGLDPLLDIIEKVKELYPTQQSDETDSSALSKTITWLAEIDLSALVVAYTGADDKDPDSVVVSISPPGRVGLPAKERYEDDKLVERYTKVVTEMISAICPSCSTLSADIEALINFEKKLVAASPSSQDRNDVTV